MKNAIKRAMRVTAMKFAMTLLCAQTGAAIAKEPTAYQLPGLREQAEIIVDKWGIPHIYAKSQDDAFFVQGFNAARDRLWQIDFWRKRGLGELAKTFGPSYTEHDRAARLFLYRGDMYREWLAYGSDAKRIAEAFASGVNAYIRETQKHPELLPAEFKQLGYQPALWTAEDIVRIRAHGLTRNATSEIARSRVACNGDVGVDELRSGLQPPWRAAIPEGLDPCTIDPKVMGAYALATAEIKFSKESVAQAQLPDIDEMLASTERMEQGTGSNNWAISASRTKSGRPILANDPHRAYSSPSLRYIAHVSAPGMDVIGAGEPFLPGVSIGHNGRIAFGLTIFRADQEDVYFYETNPQNRNEYRYRDRWEPMTVVKESVAVKGAPDRVVELKFTRHGPVVHEDPATGRAYALRVAWLDQGMAPYFGSVDFMRAQNWDQFTAAMNRWGAPSENQVYADTAGNVGWVPGGLIPIRPNWDGLMPVPGDGRYEWAGYRHNDELPREFNPSRGWVATANNNTLPKAYPADKKIGFEWADPARITRITEVLNHPGKTSVSDSMKLQTDVYSVHARQLTELLRPLKSDDGAVVNALRMLNGWDLNVTKESSAAVLYEVWFSRHLKTAILDRLAPQDKKALLGEGDSRVILGLLLQPDERLGVDPKSERDRILLDSLKAAMADSSKLLGSNPDSWQWGKLHHALFSHPLENLLDKNVQASVGPVPKSGDEFSVNSSVYRRSDFRLMTGPSFRMVLDVGGWDKSRVINTPGQSGDPASPHYRDMVSDWEAGRYVPLLYTRKAVEKQARVRILLQPSQ
nr:penicillin acylase family protein [Ottowia thiooxydans]